MSKAIRLALLLFLCLGCEGDRSVDPTDSDSSVEGGGDLTGLAVELEKCPPSGPCPIATYAYATCLDLRPFEDDLRLGVFDANQGGVATWITLVVANAPETHPYVTIELIGDDGPINFTEENGPTRLKVPFMPLGQGTLRYQDQYMIQFVDMCCAENFEGMEATLRVTFEYEGLEPAVNEWQVTLGESPWPLDDSSAQVEQCDCQNWPGDTDPSVCE